MRQSAAAAFTSALSLACEERGERGEGERGEGGGGREGGGEGGGREGGRGGEGGGEGGRKEGGMKEGRKVMVYAWLCMGVHYNNQFLHSCRREWLCHSVCVCTACLTAP